jgi:preprotein translocase subunit SecG
MTFGQMSFGQVALAWLLIGTCLLLILVILLQRGRGGGLAGAFGGGGGSSAFGAKTGDVFTWITVTFAALFVALAVVANFVFEPEALASPVAAELSPGPAGDSSAPVPITIPVGEGQGIGKVELLTKDGEVIPIDAKIMDGEAGGTSGQTAPPEGDAPKPVETPGDDDKPESTEGGGSESSNEGGKDPGK